ncbi:MAG: ribosome biogenesis GTPase Der, partial [Dehalococcoidia bacterium]
MSDVLPRVAIVGRPNVGKSSLFNRVVGERRAIIEDEPGTTRDRLEAEVEWRERRFRLVDTGGFEVEGEGAFAPLVMAQVKEAVQASVLVLFCVDARDGLTASDFDMADLVRRSGRPVLLVGTKADNEERELSAIGDTAGLGMGDPLPVSALHNLNVGLLLDAVVEHLPVALPAFESERVKVAIIGRPNVGKSMLVNALLGEERVIVSDVPGTTRDAIDSNLSAGAGEFTLIDTAGMRRPGRTARVQVERHSALRTRAAVDRADVAVLVIDGVEGVTAQDTHIASIPIELSKGLVIAVNKTDLWAEAGKSRNWSERQLRGRVRFAPWALVAYISALEHSGLDALLELAGTAREARRHRVPTG